MSEHNTRKIRTCKSCGHEIECTAKELKEHAEKCRFYKGGRTVRNFVPKVA